MYVFVFGAVMILGIVAWRLPGIVRGLDSRAVGDGEDPATYGFDLGNARIPVDRIVGSGMPRDGLNPLDDPPVMSVAEMEQISWGGHGHGKFLVSDSRVVGVEIDGVARAYPLSMLNWHEIVNDTVAGVPIAVVYSPLSDVTGVFSRQRGGDVVSFGFSGLLYQSSALIHDREGGSLWSPLLGEAVAGPAGGEALDAVPAALVRWADWVARHPDTEILRPDRTMKRVYKRKPYESYRGSDRLHFPVEPLPPDGVKKKSCVIGVAHGGARDAYAVDDIYAHAGEHGSWQTEFQGQPLRFETGKPPTVFVDAPPGVRAVPCYRFAWHAHHPGVTAE
jgi:hypothetical protein